MRCLTLAFVICSCLLVELALAHPHDPNIPDPHVADPDAPTYADYPTKWDPNDKIYYDEGPQSASDSCAGDSSPPITFEMQQLKPLDNCPQLNQNECLFIHEAEEECPCTCELRRNGIDKDGKNRPGSDQGDPQYPDPDYDPDPNPDPDPDNGHKGGLGCFDAHATVITEKGPMTMEELLGQSEDVSVLAWDAATGSARFSRVEFWLHADVGKLAEFIEIETESGEKLLLTDEHIIYRSPECNLELESVLARELEVGDCLLVAQGDQPTSTKVAELQKRSKTGVFAPVTALGSIIVDGLAASCYAHTENAASLHMVAARFMRLWNAALATVPLLTGAHESYEVPKVLFALQSLEKYFLA